MKAATNPGDLFGGHAGDYARYRPTYPDALIKYLSSLVKYRGVLWDCTCGTGQLAIPFAEHFQLVCASDINAEQIAKAPGHPGVLYTVLPAEKTDFPDEFFDMIVVGQAIHWLHHEAFYKEVNRVLNVQGVLAVIGYGLITVNAAVDAVIHRLYHNLTGPFWPPQRRFLDEGYATLPFPFEPQLALPAFEMEYQWSINDLIGYLNTWSAVKAYEQVHHENPVNLIADALQQAWGAALQQTIRFPLLIKAGRKTATL